jgi:small subunit ribosomal protein S8e
MIMDQYHGNFRGQVSKGTGGKRVKFSDKRLSQIGGTFTETKLHQKEEKKTARKIGGSKKTRIRKTQFVNVSIGNATKKAKITNVIKGNNPDFTRQNIITKGAIVQTDAGKVRITSRPGQDGSLNGIIVKE